MAAKREIPTFEPFSKVPKALKDTSFQVTRFAGHFVKFFDNGDRQFEWTEFKDSIDKLQGDDLSFDQYNRNTIANTEATVDVMAEKIVKFLKEALSVALDATAEKQLAEKISATFLNLNEAKSNGWANFSKSSSSKNSSWEYRILFATAMPDDEDYFYSLVTTIKLEADLESEESWFGLVSSSSRDFSAQIDAMELLIKRGFKNPL